MAKNLFIDTNILLSFYHFTSDDLEELRKLAVLMENNKVRLLLPGQVVDEFRRNREGKIGEALKRLREQKFNLQFPQISKDYPEYKKLRGLQKKYETGHKELLDKLEADTSTNNLKADVLIKELFDAADNLAPTDAILKRARLRMDLGNPPGKGRSLGDAINWELILEASEQVKTLFFVTDDSDYVSPLSDSLFDGFLLQEWSEKKKGALVFYKRLSAFFKDKFPEIKLASEAEKDLLIAELAGSLNFAATHAIIGKLSKYSEFTAAQVNAIVDAVISNSQVHWILSDSDVRSFVLSAISGKRKQIDRESLKRLRLLLSADDDGEDEE